MRFLLVFGLSVQTVVAAGADIQVHVTPAGVSVHTKAAPVADVLERVMSALGGTVSYTEARPLALVNVSVDEAAPTEVIPKIVEGLGLAYAFMLGPSGTTVKNLVVQAPKGVSPPPTTHVVPARSTSPAPNPDPAIIGEIFGEPVSTIESGGDDSETASEAVGSPAPAPPDGSGKAADSSPAPTSAGGPASTPSKQERGAIVPHVGASRSSPTNQ